jgi:hypothetical protein
MNKDKIQVGDLVTLDFGQIQPGIDLVIAPFSTLGWEVYWFKRAPTGRTWWYEYQLAKLCPTQEKEKSKA